MGDIDRETPPGRRCECEIKKKIQKGMAHDRYSKYVVKKRIQQVS